MENHQKRKKEKEKQWRFRSSNKRELNKQNRKNELRIPKRKD